MTPALPVTVLPEVSVLDSRQNGFTATPRERIAGRRGRPPAHITDS
jgi:hypothetical protein